MKKTKLVSHNKTTSIVSTDNEMSKLIILILAVAFVFALFYVITLFVTNNDSSSKSINNAANNDANSIQYEKILVSNIFSQKESEYYVLAYFDTDKYLDMYKSYLSFYKKNVSGAFPYYYVDVTDVFNKSFIGDKSNLDVSDIKDLKFSQTTLLRIKGNKIISIYEGNEQITGKLGRMTK